MTSPGESTPGVETSLWKLKKEGEGVNVHIWDFAGHTITHALHRFFLSERCVYILVYDGRTTDSQNQLEYWLNYVKNYGGNSKVFILVNRKDDHSPDIETNTLRRQYPSIAKVYSFSIATDKAELEEFRNDIAGYIQSNPSWNQQMPTTYFRIKEALEALFTQGDAGKNEEHITMEQFESIAHQNDIEDTTELLNNLHSLGICLWYKNIEKYNMLILNPEWISYGVYRIINWVHEQKLHSVLSSDFRAVFQGDSRYQEKHYPFLFELMKQYELAYETTNEPRLIIPRLMEKDSPAELPEFPVGESLMLRYKSEQPLPPDTISRFIVRHNQDIKQVTEQETGTKKSLVWRYGVVLENKNGSLALVMEKDRTISVSVKGEDKTTYLTTLRATLSDIFNTYQSEKPELQYHIVEDVEKATASANEKPLWLPDNQIYTWAKANRPYYSYRTQQDINLQQYIINYNINYGTLISGTGNVVDKSINKTTINFHDCNINMQGLLTELANELKENGKADEAEYLEKAAKDLDEIKEPANSEEVKKSGKLNKLNRILQDLGDENSTLYKVAKGIRNGIKIADEILGIGVKMMQLSGYAFP
jgi:GTPase SAR1 family protein